MDPLLFLFIAGSIIVTIVGLLFYRHDRRAHRRTARQEQCSFCGKRRREVRKLIAGPEIYICNECIALSSDLIAKELAKERAD